MKRKPKPTRARAESGNPEELWEDRGPGLRAVRGDAETQRPSLEMQGLASVVKRMAHGSEHDRGWEQGTRCSGVGSQHEAQRGGRTEAAAGG